MKEQTWTRLMILKIVCCAALLFFLLGGFTLLAGLGTGNLLLIGLGVAGLIWAMLVWMKREKKCNTSNT